MTIKHTRWQHRSFSFTCVVSSELTGTWLSLKLGKHSIYIGPSLG